ncbi:hypothetical protein FA95DRAFT_1613088 [Auriscalpium vulgare]|uniref:Uncharacterized protein n=1 Tax=Auriscalpium vulgare TaxID=40419 RepID=A0ACB8R492_9AGAM|nr:hypothetical protein FA95DRAFT_1613088 [Auriscalpium vulgare]
MSTCNLPPTHVVTAKTSKQYLWESLRPSLPHFSLSTPKRASCTSSQSPWIRNDVSVVALLRRIARIPDLRHASSSRGAGLALETVFETSKPLSGYSSLGQRRRLQRYTGVNSCIAITAQILLASALHIGPSPSKVYPDVISRPRDSRSGAIMTPPHLPFDIHARIIQFVYITTQSHDVDYRTLSACALICKDWVAPAQRLLFRRIPYQAVDHRWWRRDTITLLLRAITISPHLGPYVVSIPIILQSDRDNEQVPRDTYYALLRIAQVRLDITQHLRASTLSKLRSLGLRPAALVLDGDMIGDIPAVLAMWRSDKQKNARLLRENEELCRQLRNMWLLATTLGDLDFDSGAATNGNGGNGNGHGMSGGNARRGGSALKRRHNSGCVDEVHLTLQQPTHFQAAYGAAAYEALQADTCRVLLLGTGRPEPAPPAKEQELEVGSLGWWEDAPDARRIGDSLRSLIIPRLPHRPITLPRTLRHFGYHVTNHNELDTFGVMERLGYLVSALADESALPQLREVSVTRSASQEVVQAFEGLRESRGVEVLVYADRESYPRARYVDWIA